MRLPRLELKLAFFLDCLIVMALAVLVFGVFERTYKPGTWFMGWDSVMSEFNLGLAWNRTVNGVWQEFQGLGLVGGHGYVSDLARLPLLWLLSLWLPAYMIRYVFAFFMWYVGAVGAYFLSKQLLNSIFKLQLLQSLFGMVAALVYLFHPFTIQNFYVMHDAFGWFYALLPWLILTFSWVSVKTTRIRLLIWFGVSFLFSFSGFIPPVFVGTGLFLGILALTNWLQQRKKRTLKKRLVVLGLFIIANAYWLLPFTYFTVSQRRVYLEAKLNQETTPENILKSENYGKWDKLISGQGFYFDALDVDFDKKQTVPILQSWMGWLDRPLNKGLLIGIFILGSLGWVTSWKLLNNSALSGLPLAMLVILGLLIIGDPPFNWLAFIWYKIPVIGQAFRIPFTKLSSLYVLCFALLVTFALAGIYWWMRKVRLIRNITVIAMVFGVVGSMVWVSQPVWQGNFLYQRSKVAIPQDYFELINFFKNQPKKARVAVLPIHTYNGWYIQDWGYTGSGFWFYGVEQPVLDRTFDVWSRENESYYQQMSQAVYEGDVRSYEKILQQYDISYVVIDKSVLDLGGKKESLNLEGINSLMTKANLIKVFGQGNLEVFKQKSEFNGFIKAANSYQQAVVEVEKTRRDVVYQEVGDYVEGEGIEYPFADLMKENINQVLYEKDQVVLERKTKNSRGVNIPGIQMGTKLTLGGTVNQQGEQLVIDWDNLAQINGLAVGLPPVYISNNGLAGLVKIGDNLVVNQNFKITAEVGKPIPLSIYEQAAPKTISVNEFLTKEAVKCWERSTGGTIESNLIGDERGFKVTDASACVSLSLGKMEKSGILKIDLPSRLVKGEPARFCVVKEGEDEVCLQKNNYVQVKAGEIYWLDVIARPPSIVGGNTEIYYGVPQATFYPEIIKTEIASNIWDDLLKSRKLEPIGRENILKVRIPAEPKLVNWSREGKPVAENCDLFKRGIVSKTGNTYIAKDRGAACDQVGLEETNNHQEYLLRWVGENISGRSLKVYVYNEASQRNDLETLLPTGRFDTSFGLLSWPNLPETSYNLTIENRSFGSEASQNRIDQVELYPVPLSWISGIKVGEENKITNNLQIKEVKKSGTSFYRVNVEGDGLLALSQGYEKGWLAFQDWKLLKHVKVNGWENGWLIPSHATSVRGDASVTIFYWPQMLEWLGLGLLPFTFGYVILNKWNMRKRSVGGKEGN